IPGCGVPAGATMACQDVLQNPAIPASIHVGTSGSAGERRDPLLTIPLMRPAFTRARRPGAVLTANCTRPDANSDVAAPSPVNGTWTMLTPVTLLKSSP